MNNDTVISVVNKRGRVLWLPYGEASILINQKNVREVKYPKENYLPQYDEAMSPNIGMDDEEEIGDTEQQVLAVDIL